MSSMLSPLRRLAPGGLSVARRLSAVCPNTFAGAQSLSPPGTQSTPAPTPASFRGLLIGQTRGLHRTPALFDESKLSAEDAFVTFLKSVGLDDEDIGLLKTEKYNMESILNATDANLSAISLKQGPRSLLLAAIERRKDGLNKDLDKDLAIELRRGHPFVKKMFLKEQEFKFTFTGRGPAVDSIKDQAKKFYTETKERDTQPVFLAIVGPGTGKSRLLDELPELLEAEPSKEEIFGSPAPTFVPLKVNYGNGGAPHQIDADDPVRAMSLRLLHARFRPELYFSEFLKLPACKKIETISSALRVIAEDVLQMAEEAGQTLPSRLLFFILIDEVNNVLGTKEKHQQFREALLSIQEAILQPKPYVRDRDRDHEIATDAALVVAGTKDPADTKNSSEQSTILWRSSFGSAIRLPLTLLTSTEMEKMVSKAYWGKLNQFQKHLLLLSAGHPRRIKHVTGLFQESGDLFNLVKAEDIEKNVPRLTVALTSKTGTAPIDYIHPQALQALMLRREVYASLRSPLRQGHDDGFYVLDQPHHESPSNVTAPFLNLIAWANANQAQVPFAKRFLTGWENTAFEGHYSLHYLHPSTWQSLELFAPFIESLRLTSLNLAHLGLPSSLPPLPSGPVPLREYFKHALSSDLQSILLLPPEQPLDYHIAEKPIGEDNDPKKTSSWKHYITDLFSSATKAQEPIGENNNTEKQKNFGRFIKASDVGLTVEEAEKRMIEGPPCVLTNGPFAMVDAMTTPLKATVMGEDRLLIIAYQFKHTRYQEELTQDDFDNEFKKHRLLFDPDFDIKGVILNSKGGPISDWFKKQRREAFQELLTKVKAKRGPAEIMSLFVVITNRSGAEKITPPPGSLLISREKLLGYYGPTFAYPLLNPHPDLKFD